MAIRHRLVPDHRTDDVAAVTDSLLALHSSDPATVFLSAAARMPDPSLAAIDAALYEQRSIVRHHAFRRTLWVMTPSVARWAHAAATAKIAAVERTKLVEALRTDNDLDDPERWRAGGFDAIRTLLDEHGPLTTREIGRRLPELTRRVTFGAGTRNPAELAAHTRILLLAGFEAELVRTRPSHGWNTAEYAWCDTETWIGEPLTGCDVVEASAGILHRWLGAFGPATEVDIRWWTGWTVKQMRSALDLIDAQPVVLDEGQPAWVAADDAGDTPSTDPWIALLPGLDPTTMGWKERHWYLDDVAAARTFDRWGNAGPTIWRNGEVVGGWAHRDDGRVACELHVGLDRREQSMLAEQIDRFLELAGDTRVRCRFPAPNQNELLS